MIQFGNTWWGNMWLYALEGIDFENRLPRGKTYARKGAVSELLLNRRSISASVEGSYERDYIITIKLPPFTKREKQKITEIIVTNPLYLARLLNKTLPHELYDELQALGIEPFPANWDEMKGRCSCPDWAVPCKHIAAVIYKIANMIDIDPFTVFTLRDFDLLSELNSRGYRISSDNLRIKNIDDLVISNSDVLRDLYVDDDPIEREEPDLSLIPASGDHLLSLLKEKPAFYLHGDFKQLMKKMYKDLTGVASRLLKEDDYGEPLPADCHVEIIIEEELIEARINLKGEQTEQVLEPLQLFMKLLAIPAAELINYEEPVRALHSIARFTLRMLEQSCFIPQLLMLSDEDSFVVRWIPPLHNSEVESLFEQLNRLVPRDLAAINLWAQEGGRRHLKGEEQLMTIISLFITAFIVSCNSKIFKSRELVEQLFFGGMVFNRHNRFDLQEIPPAIERWLSPYYLSHSDFRPILQIDESEDPELLSINLLVRVNEQILPFSRIFDDDQWLEVRGEIMTDILLLTDYLFELESYIQSQGRVPLLIELTHFTPILLEVLPAIRMLGIQVILPKALKQLVRPQTSLAVSGGKPGSTLSYIDLKSLLTFKWKIALGKELVDPAQFAAEVAGLEGLVRYRDRYIFIDPKEIAALLKRTEREPKLKPGELLALGLEESYGEAAISLSDEAREIYRRLLDSPPVEPPRGLQAELRPYQLEGYRWLYRNSVVGFGSILADDMGLGKTIQVITLLLKLKEEGQLGKKQAIVIVPTSLLTNWEHELAHFAPDLKLLTYHGSGRALELGGVDLVVTSYGVVRMDIELLTGRSWQAVIIDEAQNIKNDGSSQTKAIKQLKGKIKIALSGTPVENRLDEYWSIFDFTNKGYLGSRKAFHQDYALPIELYRDEEQLSSFLKRTSPFIMRRLKSDKKIISDLPEKLEVDQFSALTSRQAALYQNVVDTTMEQIKQSQGMVRRGLILKLLTSLKQICNHPAHFLKEGELDPVHSGKAVILMGLLESLYSSGEKVLIFTQYREMGEILQQMIESRFRGKVDFLHGAVSRKRRDEMVECFQKERQRHTLLLSLKAGGTGLNLTAATTVIHYDLWWNPAAESQATDRAYRIGQKQKVTVYRLLTEGTLEERIDNMLKEKRQLSDLTLAEGGGWIGELGDSELAGLLSL